MVTKNKICKDVIEKGGAYVGFGVGFNALYKKDKNILAGLFGGIIGAMIGDIFSPVIILTLPVSVPIILYHNRKKD